ncbi:MAG: DEAD/DEAH box helicase family protein, partial [Chlamydiia bacterium]|nr:DEAD/DEAH box helicase family protein [Chlamydiia bacterium]
MESLDIEAIVSLLAPNGRLQTFLPQFESRAEQIEMLTLIARSFNDHSLSLVEAGTGTGKSIAYLLPSILKAVKHGERVLLSTKTINLQQQLLEKDLPVCAKALGISFKAVLVKGMGNYLCLRKLEDTQAEIELSPSEEREQLRAISAWSGTTRDGSKAELGFQPYGGVWEKVSCESDTCSYRKCPHFDRCYFFKARAEAEDAHLLVSNHHLLFADLAMRSEQENFNEVALLPPYRHLVLDEAHHLEDIATDFFGESLSRVEMMRVMGRLASERGGQQAGRLPILQKKVQSLYSKGPKDDIEPLLLPLQFELPLARKTLIQHIADFFQALALFVDQKLSGAEEKGVLRLNAAHFQEPFWMEEIAPVAEQLLSSLKQYVFAILKVLQRAKDLDVGTFQEETRGLITEIEAFCSRLERQGDLLRRFCFTEMEENKVRWLEVQAKGTLQNVYLVEAKLDLSGSFAETLFKPFDSVHLCSATMATGGNFEFIKNRLGLKKAVDSGRTLQEAIFDSPFHFQRQALFVVPPDMPNPQDPSFLEAAVEKICEGVEISRGGAFVLFTSYSMMRKAHDLVRARLAQKKYTFFKQGDDSRHHLLARFKLAPRGILFGTDSFWEGVDVVGEALKLVILVKLPFRVPSEPIFQARSEKLEKEGGEPFFDYALPQAIVKFKQGFGRLIRHRHDRGVVVVLDPRVLTKGYGQAFLKSLPPCPKAYPPKGQFAATLEAFYKQT